MKKEYNTSRLLLSELSLENAEFIRELVNTPGWIRFIGERNVKTQEDALVYVNNIMNNKDIIYLVVKLQASSTAIGVISFIKRTYLPNHDIGFAFLPQYHGNGYAYEAANEVLKDVLTDPAHEVVLATTLNENVASIKLLEKLGFEISNEIKVDDENLLVHSIASMT